MCVCVGGGGGLFGSKEWDLFGSMVEWGGGGREGGMALGVN